MSRVEELEIIESAVIIGAWCAVAATIWAAAALAEFWARRQAAREKAADEETERVELQAKWNLEAAARRAAWAPPNSVQRQPAQKPGGAS